MDDRQVARKLQEQLGSREAQAAWAEFLEAYSPVILQIVQLFEREPDHAADCFLFVCEQLNQNQFRRLRRFKPDGPARFVTWLRVVVRNLCLDWHRKEFGRQRVFDSIARLAAFDQDVYSKVYEQGLSQEEALFSLGTKYPRLTVDEVGESVGRIQQALTPRQLWLLSTRRPKVESLESESADNQESLERQIPDPRPDPQALSVTREDQAALERALNGLSAPERLLIKLRFEQDLTLREVAELLDLKDPQTADRRIREVLERLRKELSGKTDPASV
jgi:RNA polymerase sigma factor (sigma-70 family)